MINVTERNDEKIGWVYNTWKVAEGFKLAFDTETKWNGVVNDDGMFFPVLRLNGWRARTLAEIVTGTYDHKVFKLGSMWIVDAEVLQGLPDFDSTQTEIVKSFRGPVHIEVVTIDPGYGPHIKLISTEKDGDVK